ncbi:MAG: STAS domain-containing protein [Spirochaetes bacterium]|nr:STAS domain-containing protein [Spirochaetota bacterium]
MHIERKDAEGECTFIIMEEMTAQNVTGLSDELTHFVKTDTRDANIDLSYVRKIDSMAIAALIRFKNMMTEEGRKMHLVNPNDNILRVLDISGLDKFLLE